MDADALLADLDPDQHMAVAAAHGLVAVIAGAGSGKTRVLTRRIAYRIASGQADARHSVALTFTREAAGELRRRLRLLGVREHVEAGTFHSVMLAVQRQRWADLGAGPKTVLADRRRYIAELVGSGGRQAVESLVAEIEWAAARGVGPEHYAEAARRAGRRPAGGPVRVADRYAEFEQLKRRRGVIDFDDVLAHTVRDLERDPTFAASLRWRFRHLYVDEAQDLNPLQHRLVSLLHGERDDLFLVGDPAQAIYGFNGADPALLIEVEDRFPGIEVIRLPVNHRCTPQIVTVGTRVLAAAGMRSDYRARRGDGAHVDVLAADDENDEARRVAQWLARVDPRLVRSGSVAVLARTNQLLQGVHDAIAAVGLPIRRVGIPPSSPLRRVLDDVLHLPSAARLRAWAHDVLDGPRDDAGAPEAVAAVQVADVVLEFLRELPLGDGAALRSWIATSNPFPEGDEGVDLLTFHGSKGREWHTVVVLAAETSLVPHKSATTSAARAEEARLLYVACTRATDRSLISHAARRGGYARQRTPFLDDVEFGPAAAAPPPAYPKPARDRLLARLTAGGRRPHAGRGSIRRWSSPTATCGRWPSSGRRRSRN